MKPQRRSMSAAENTGQCDEIILDALLMRNPLCFAKPPLRARTKTTVKLDGKTVTLIRTGTFPSHMLFSEDERHVGLYQTPIGQDMTIATHTSHVCNTVGENGGRLVIDYTVEVDNSLMGEHHFEMVVS